MAGASGAKLKFKGDWVYKNCKDAKEQVEWFEKARTLDTHPNIHYPIVELKSSRCYRMQFIPGHLAVYDSNLSEIISILRSQIDRWRGVPTSEDRTDWESYLSRLRDHVSFIEEGVDKSPYDGTIDMMRLLKPSPSFCHGDLTLENVLVNSEGVWLIDPNYKPGLFQSYLLDLGKLGQSLTGYHVLRGQIETSLQLKTEFSMNDFSLITLSHWIRLRKYQPEELRPSVDITIKHLYEQVKHYGAIRLWKTIQIY